MLVVPDFKLSELGERWEEFIDQRSIRVTHASHYAVTQSVAVLLQETLNVIRHLNRPNPPVS